MGLYISAPWLLNIPYPSPPSGSCPPRSAPRPKPAPALGAGQGAERGGQWSGAIAPAHKREREKHNNKPTKLTLAKRSSSRGYRPALR